MNMCCAVFWYIKSVSDANSSFVSAETSVVSVDSTPDKLITMVRQSHNLHLCWHCVNFGIRQSQTYCAIKCN